MNCRIDGTTAGLVANWTFDNSDLADHTGAGHNGTVGGVPGSLTYAPLVALQNCKLAGADGPPPLNARPVALWVSPLPSRGKVDVRFDLPRESDVALELFDVAGRRLGTVASGSYSAGSHTFSRDMSRMGGSRGGAGLFYLRLAAAGQQVSRRVMVLR